MNFVSCSVQNRKAVIFIANPATIYGKQMLTNCRIHCLRISGCLLALYINIYIYLQDLALNNPNRLICHKTQHIQTIFSPLQYPVCILVLFVSGFLVLFPLIIFADLITINLPCVIYWPSNEPSIKRCTCVNKRKNSGSRWALNNNMTRAKTVWVGWRQDVSGVRTSSRQRAWALSDPRLSNPAKMRKKCCYGRRRTWGQYSSLFPSPAHLSHTRNITLSRIKRERLYFYKIVYSFVHWSSSLCLIMFRIYLYIYICIRVI